MQVQVEGTGCISNVVAASGATKGFYKLQDQEGHGQAFPEPQEETLHVDLGSSLALTC